MSNKSKYFFSGEQRRQPSTPHPDAPANPEPYVASPELVNAVNLAIYLNRPLLLEGEAGCGKTRLARAVAYELGLPFYVWYVRSTSKAQEGLYSYDAILRLHDVQTRQLNTPAGGGAAEVRADASARRDPSHAVDYLKLGPLGKAFELRGCPAVVLIDEIDKADIDFPNDLLTVLDDPWEFEIPETGQIISAAADSKPIVIITSNKEKGNLPSPFLRRCIYYFLDFPHDEGWLREIVEAHYHVRDSEPPSPDLLQSAITLFLKIRTDLGLYKKPSTSEFLDWLEALRAFLPPEAQTVELLENGRPPYPELLIKLRADWQRSAVAK
jgi:MoxR-like ATPase